MGNGVLENNGHSEVADFRHPMDIEEVRSKCRNSKAFRNWLYF